MLTTLAGLGLNKRQNRGAGPRTEALHAASEVLKQLGRKATLAVILRLEGLEPPPWCARHRVYRDTPRTWRLDMHAGFETHGTEHGQQVIKCGFEKKKRVTAKKTTNALRMLPPVVSHRSHRPVSCSAPRWGGWVSLASLLLPSTVTPVRATPVTRTSCRGTTPHTPVPTGLWPRTPSSHFRSGGP